MKKEKRKRSAVSKCANIWIKQTETYSGLSSGTTQDTGRESDWPNNGLMRSIDEHL